MILFADAFAADQAAGGATTAATTADAAPYELSQEKVMRDNILILGLIFFIFYFLLIRPQQKRLKMQRDMLKSLEKGNKVITSGGIIGTISKFEGDDVVVVEVAQNIKLRVARSAITEVVDDKAAVPSANDN